MLEINADLWSVPADAVVITTNGTIKKNGEAVMGRGCAKEAAQLYPDLPRLLGNRISECGNYVHLFSMDDRNLVSMPVKHGWREPASLTLIRQSLEELVELTNNVRWQRVVMPRPGCGNGGLSWFTVKLLIGDKLDDRFIVVDYVRPS